MSLAPSCPHCDRIMAPTGCPVCDDAPDTARAMAMRSGRTLRATIRDEIASEDVHEPLLERMAG